MRSQSKYLTIEFADSIGTSIPNKLNPKTAFPTKEKLLQEVAQISDLLNKEGFLSHTISLLQENDSTYNGLILLNPAITEITLDFKAKLVLPPFIKDKQLTIPFSQLENTLAAIYDYYESEGATFTEIKLEQIVLLDEKLMAEVQIHKSENRYIDKVIVKGYTDFPKKYIKQHLKIKPTTVYNQEILEQTSNALQNLDFITEIRKPEVLFTKDSTHLYIYVSKKSANRFDGLVGFSNNENSGKLTLNGYLDLELNNNFHQGEQLAVFWSNNGNQQEEFRFKIATPYLANTPITPELNFQIYKQDSTFITIDFDANLSYLLSQKSTVGVTWKTKNSTDLLEDSNNPSVSSYKTNLYGATYTYKQPKTSRTQFSIQSAANYGNKTSENIKTPQYSLFLDFSLTERLGKRSNFYLHNRTETLQSNTILYNELFQIGGANTIRGFYEQSIFCSSYNFTNLEFRILTNSASYLYAFSDLGFTEDQTNNSDDSLYSFGLGYAYKTKGGVINLNYAFGKKNKDPFDFNQGIFHVKFVNSF